VLPPPQQLLAGRCWLHRYNIDLLAHLPHQREVHETHKQNIAVQGSLQLDYARVCSSGCSSSSSAAPAQQQHLALLLGAATTAAGLTSSLSRLNLRIVRLFSCGSLACSRFARSSTPDPAGLPHTITLAPMSTKTQSTFQAKGGGGLF
jgi:hypothetical protein